MRDLENLPVSSPSNSRETGVGEHFQVGRIWSSVARTGLQSSLPIPACSYPYQPISEGSRLLLPLSSNRMSTPNPAGVAGSTPGSCSGQSSAVRPSRERLSIFQTKTKLKNLTTRREKCGCRRIQRTQMCADQALHLRGLLSLVIGSSFLILIC